MIENIEVAKRIVSRMDAISADINELIRDVQSRCSDAEFQAFRQVAGRVMGYIYTDVVAPLHSRHAELEPPELRE
jgi:hypothetical protein